jgi:hypothetical protein
LLVFLTKTSVQPGLISKDKTIVVYGATVANGTEGAIARIDDVFIHPDYFDPSESNQGEYDAAMVRLIEPLMLAPGFAEAKPLAFDSENYAPGKVCVMAGFGNIGVRSK